MATALGISLFIQEAVDNPVFFFSVVLTVVVSVTLHELGHAFAALWQGDPTPRLAGHVTLDPLKHMGATSIVMLFLVGIAWGATPVDPTRLRSRHAEALVSLAGPLVNLLLALLGLTALGLWMRLGGVAESGFPANLRLFLFVFGAWNLVLMLFNLIPIPPLDGSNVVASYVRPYRRLVSDPNNRGMWFAVFIALFLGAGSLWDVAFQAAGVYLGWLGA